MFCHKRESSGWFWATKKRSMAGTVPSFKAEVASCSTLQRRGNVSMVSWSMLFPSHFTKTWMARLWSGHQKNIKKKQSVCQMWSLGDVRSKPYVQTGSNMHMTCTSIDRIISKTIQRVSLIQIELFKISKKSKNIANSFSYQATMLVLECQALAISAAHHMRFRVSEVIKTTTFSSFLKRSNFVWQWVGHSRG